MTQKLVKAVLLVLMASVALAGCGNANQGNVATSDPQAEQVTISFWIGNVIPERSKFWEEEVIKPFEEKYPNIKVEFLGIPGPPNEKIDIALAAGSPPDVAYPVFSANYINQGVFEPLDSYYENSALFGKINEDAVNTVRSVDDKNQMLYAIPSTLSPWNIWIRPDLFAEAGVKEPGTWDEFFDAAVKLTDKSQGKYGFSIRGGSGSAKTLEFLMYSYSGIPSMFTEDGKSTINDPLHVEFLEKYLGLYNIATPEDDVTKGWTELLATFQSGKAAMIAHNLGAGVPLEEAFEGDLSKFKMLPYPKSVKGTQVHPAVLPGAFPMFKDSKNKDAAWKLIEFISEKTQNNEYAKLIAEIPLNSENLDEPWLKEREYMVAGAELINSPDTHVYTMPHFLPEYTTSYSNYVEPNIQKVMLNNMTAQEMLDDWATNLEKAMSDYKANQSKN